MTRRRAMKGLVGAGAVTVAGPLFGTSEARTFFERVDLPIGLQTYTLGNEAGKDLDRTFAEVAAIGFRDIELPNLYGRTAREIAAAASQAGLKISSLHLAVTTRGAPAGLSLSSPPAEIAEALGTLSARRAVLPIAPFPESFHPAPGTDIQTAIAQAFTSAGEDHWKRTAALLNERAAALKPHGIALGYHNHNIEFAPIDGTSGWDILVRDTDPALVEFEIDTGWIATSGLDPAAFLRGLAGRVTQLHVKDVAPGNATNFALAMKPAEVGAGTLDWKAILPAAYEAGVRHFYVEQEPPFAIPRIEAARRSHDFLAQLHA